MPRGSGKLKGRWPCGLGTFSTEGWETHAQIYMTSHINTNMEDPGFSPGYNSVKPSWQSPSCLTDLLFFFCFVFIFWVSIVCKVPYYIPASWEWTVRMPTTGSEGAEKRMKLLHLHCITLASSLLAFSRLLNFCKTQSTLVSTACSMIMLSWDHTYKMHSKHMSDKNMHWVLLCEKLIIRGGCCSLTSALI